MFFFLSNLTTVINPVSSGTGCARSADNFRVEATVKKGFPHENKSQD